MFGTLFAQTKSSTIQLMDVDSLKKASFYVGTAFPFYPHEDGWDFVVKNDSHDYQLNTKTGKWEVIIG